MGADTFEGWGAWARINGDVSRVLVRREGNPAERENKSHEFNADFALHCNVIPDLSARRREPAQMRPLDDEKRGCQRFLAASLTAR
jgi:hypothetical protein